jgi:hypothetical protein
MLRTALFVFLPAVLIGCSLTGSDDDIDTPLVQTDKTRYTATLTSDSTDGIADYSFSMKVRYQNRTATTIYLRSCGEDRPVYTVTTPASDTARSGYEQVWACGATTPIPLRPGEVRRDTFRIDGPTSRDGRTSEPLGVLEGSFRFVYQASRSENEDGDRLPERLTSSNVFEVQIAE